MRESFIFVFSGSSSVGFLMFEKKKNDHQSAPRNPCFYTLKHVVLVGVFIWRGGHEFAWWARVGCIAPSFRAG